MCHIVALCHICSHYGIYVWRKRGRIFPFLSCKMSFNTSALYCNGNISFLVTKRGNYMTTAALSANMAIQNVDPVQIQAWGKYFCFLNSDLCLQNAHCCYLFHFQLCIYYWIYDCNLILHGFWPELWLVFPQASCALRLQVAPGEKKVKCLANKELWWPLRARRSSQMLSTT